jgi:hypothetical protein
MEVAHRLGERAHRITKERDPSTGKLLENRQLDHIEDEKEFEREWFNRAERYGWKDTNGASFDAHTNNLLIAPPSYGHRRALSQEPRRLAIDQTPSSRRNSHQKERSKN